MRRVVPLIAVALLAGCATNSRPDVRDQMVGLSSDQLSDCMGEPARKTTEGTTETWTYFEADGPDASPLDMPLEPISSPEPVQDMGSKSCLVTIKLEADKVMAVNYANLAISRQDDECAPAIQRCAR